MSDTPMSASASSAWYGRDISDLDQAARAAVNTRRGGGGGASPYAQSGDRHAHLTQHGEHYDLVGHDTDGGRETRTHLIPHDGHLDAVRDQQPHNLYSADSGAWHSADLTVEFTAPRKVLLSKEGRLAAANGIGPTVVAVKTPRAVLMPHTFQRVDEEVAQLADRPESYYKWDGVALGAIEVLSARTNASQPVGVIMPKVSWSNVGHHTSANSKKVLVALAGDPNGTGSGEVIVEPRLVIDNRKMHESALYGNFGDSNVDDLASKQLRARVVNGVEIYDVLHNSDLYHKIRAKEPHWGRDEQGFAHDIAKMYETQCRIAMSAGAATRDPYVRDVDPSIALTISSAIVNMRPYVRDINADTDLVFQLVGLNPKGEVESPTNTMYDNLPADDPRVSDFYNQQSVTTVTFRLHYVIPPKKQEVDASAARDVYLTPDQLFSRIQAKPA